MGGDSDFPVFRPRFGKAPRKSGGGGFRNAMLAAVVATGIRRQRLARAGRRNVRVAVGAPRGGARKVVVKARFVKMTPSGAKAAALHLKYIERDGVERDGSRGHLYDADGPTRADDFEQARDGEKWQYRLIVSPEDAAELDLTAYVRRLMAQVERDMGQRVEWAAVNHYDTDHPHAHVVVRGVDHDGRDLRFDREYISQGLRWRAQELATLELGPRTGIDVERTLAREITQERCTSLDRELERRAQDNVVDLAAGPARARGIDAATLVARLRHLEELGVAERTSESAWTLKGGWSTQLRDMGSRGDIIKQMHAAVRGDAARYRIVMPGEGIEPTLAEPGPVYHGRVVDKGLSDELAGRYYAVLETPSGNALHVPLDARAAQDLRSGDLVTFRSRPEERDPAKPDAPIRHRVFVDRDALGLEDQVRHRGPVELDRLAGTTLAAHGYGGDLRLALAERAATLRGLGIDPSDPQRTAKLRAVERQDIGQSFARREGQSLLTEIPTGFEGRVELGGRGADGTAYAVISDGNRCVAVRAGPELTVRAGQRVALSRDPSGKLVVREPDLDRGR